uniref:Uncharacterized protein n=1 Tax=mine drainage metagenome TaxID=410659 RepID=E6QGH5_9ZZZZ
MLCTAPETAAAIRFPKSQHVVFGFENNNSLCMCLRSTTFGFLDRTDVRALTVTKSSFVFFCGSSLLFKSLTSLT